MKLEELTNRVDNNTGLSLLIKHKNNSDIAFSVGKVVYRKEPTYHTLSGGWVNVAAKNSDLWFHMGILENIKIKEDDLDNWEFI